MASRVTSALARPERCTTALARRTLFLRLLVVAAAALPRAACQLAPAYLYGVVTVGGYTEKTCILSVARQLAAKAAGFVSIARAYEDRNTYVTSVSVSSRTAQPEVDVGFAVGISSPSYYTLDYLRREVLRQMYVSANLAAGYGAPFSTVVACEWRGYSSCVLSAAPPNCAASCGRFVDSGLPSVTSVNVTLISMVALPLPKDISAFLPLFAPPTPPPGRLPAPPAPPAPPTLFQRHQDKILGVVLSVVCAALSAVLAYLWRRFQLRERVHTWLSAWGCGFLAANLPGSQDAELRAACEDAAAARREATAAAKMAQELTRTHAQLASNDDGGLSPAAAS